MALRDKFLREVGRLDLPVATGPLAEVTEADLAAVPEPAARYLRFMGVVGRPRDWSFRLRFDGRFRMKREGSWLPCEVWQYDSVVAMARLFTMRIAFAGIFSVIARDTYVDGRGRMLGKLFDLFTVVDGSGEEFDIGELVTFLNDMVLLAPSMLLVPAVEWQAVDDASFDLVLRDRERSVRGRVFVDERGAPTDFETTDRYWQDPASGELVRTRWTTPIASLAELDGRMVIQRAKAVWHPPEGEMAYADFVLDLDRLVYNVPPGR